jgi:hypothetical protein
MLFAPVFTVQARLSVKQLFRISAAVSFFRLPDCWLEIGVYPEDPAIGHLDTVFLGFPLSLSKY